MAASFVRKRSFVKDSKSASGGVMLGYARVSKPRSPTWPRAVRLGVDCATRVGIASIETDEAADQIAYVCFALGNLQQRDPKGDPPATCTALAHAEAAGADYARAFRDATAELARSDAAIPALPAAAMRLLQQAARGERVRDGSTLTQVLDAAEQLAR
jgi:hypothetical protein